MAIYWPKEGETMLVDGDDDDAEVEVPVEPSLLVKWMLDGAKTLSEAAAELRLIADNYEATERDGWQLAEPINDGRADLTRSGADSPPS